MTRFIALLATDYPGCILCMLAVSETFFPGNLKTLPRTEFLQYSAILAG